MRISMSTRSTLKKGSSALARRSRKVDPQCIVREDRIGLVELVTQKSNDSPLGKAVMQIKFLVQVVGIQCCSMILHGA